MNVSTYINMITFGDSQAVFTATFFSRPLVVISITLASKAAFNGPLPVITTNNLPFK
jgi:hypothetical protein